MPDPKTTHSTALWAAIELKVSKSRKQFMVSSILSKNERNSLSWASFLLKIVSFVRFLNFGRIEKIMTRFQDCLTFMAMAPEPKEHFLCAPVDFEGNFLLQSSHWACSFCSWLPLWLEMQNMSDNYLTYFCSKIIWCGSLLLLGC